MTQTHKLIEETIEKWNKTIWPIWDTKEDLIVRIIKDLEAIKASTTDVFGNTEQLIDAIMEDLDYFNFIVDYDEVRKVITKHLSPKKEIEKKVEISPYDLKWCKCWYLPFKDDKYCGRCWKKIKWID